MHLLRCCSTPNKKKQTLLFQIFYLKNKNVKILIHFARFLKKTQKSNGNTAGCAAVFTAFPSHQQ